MRCSGITYDTGFLNGFTSTHEPFDSTAVRSDLQVIRDELHCTAVRLTGGDPERLDLAARHAADLGLEVWFSPFTYELEQDALLALLLDCAERAERLRQQGAQVVLVTGAELSLFTKGFLPGKTADDRLRDLLTRHPDTLTALGTLPARMNAFLQRAVQAVRTRFAGPITYAAIHFEGVDWTPFDFVAMDLYRTKANAPHFRAAVQSLTRLGKPVAITEFGCATYRGADDLGAAAMDIIEYQDGHAVGLKGEYERDEEAQAQCIVELAELFKEEGIDTAFVCTFACFYLPHQVDGRPDLDLGSFGIVRVSAPEAIQAGAQRWAPKASFDALSAAYR
ncbi:hypothetical protein [Deinococcus hopiensis]|uniref:Abortive infection protein n=1 Tax=Deinococcus hopiensis KR-140 TaxID=695939 RepID=A0A1W1UWH6_9DEIO|nr:hypothetical protein [Deinococcus hopiensis]SMB85515.1 hypothetical protein SAMN00790413_03426 [Deinococcus hopiensis KR-140]